MPNPKITSLVSATSRLTEVLKLLEDDITRDSAIIRFQFCYDLAWKSLKEELKSRGLECFSPRECFKSAFAEGLIDNEDLWLKMIKDRNEIAHVYDIGVAKAIYSGLSSYLGLFNSLIAQLQS